MLQILAVCAGYASAEPGNSPLPVVIEGDIGAPRGLLPNDGYDNRRDYERRSSDYDNGFDDNQYARSGDRRRRDRTDRRRGGGQRDQLRRNRNQGRRRDGNRGRLDRGDNGQLDGGYERQSDRRDGGDYGRLDEQYERRSDRRDGGDYDRGYDRGYARRLAAAPEAGRALQDTVSVNRSIGDIFSFLNGIFGNNHVCYGPPHNTPRHNRPPSILVTTSGTRRQRQCIFPFKYNGACFTQCTVVGDEDGLRWCSTMTDRRGNHVPNQQEWGYCPLQEHEECNVGHNSIPCERGLECVQENGFPARDAPRSGNRRGINHFQGQYLTCQRPRQQLGLGEECGPGFRRCESHLECLRQNGFPARRERPGRNGNNRRNGQYLTCQYPGDNGLQFGETCDPHGNNALRCGPNLSCQCSRNCGSGTSNRRRPRQQFTCQFGGLPRSGVNRDATRRSGGVNLGERLLKGTSKFRSSKFRKAKKTKAAADESTPSPRKL